MYSQLKQVIFFAFLILVNRVSAEPWVDTRDSWLRADIEILSDAGVINVPVSSYPLMWSSIVQELDNTSTENIAMVYREAFWRVKHAAKKAVSGNTIKNLSVTAANSPQIFRSFGDSSREELQLTAKTSSMTKNWAWNFEVTHVSSPSDKDHVRLDNSYVSVVFGNWVTSLGYIERWWGPSWHSTDLLSNNARPQLGVSFQRNYSVPENNKLLSWLGPWSVTGFISELDDEPIDDKNLAGLSFSFLPHEALELSLRVTTLFGGGGRDKSFSSLVESFLAQEECELSQLACDQRDALGGYSQTGDRIAGWDIRWKLPVGYPISMYASAYGESESEIFPSKNVQNVGLSSSFEFLGNQWKWMLESSYTTLGDNDYNQMYESYAYVQGYRYLNRSIGSTFDNDSSSTSFTLLGRVDRDNEIKVSYSKVQLNKDGQGRTEFAQHALTEYELDVSELSVEWRYQMSSMGTLSVIFEYFDMDKSINQLNADTSTNNKFEDDYRVALSWTYLID